MDSRNFSFDNHALIVGFALVVCSWMTSGTVWGQVRSKQPDRGSYQSPRLEPVDVEPIGSQSERTDAAEPSNKTTHNRAAGNRATSMDTIRQVDHRRPELVKPQARLAGIPQPLADPSHADLDAVEPSGAWSDETVIWDEAAIQFDSPILHDPSCDGCGSCDECCDSYGCDSMGSAGWSNASLSFDPCRWFGSIEVLLMFRKGDRLPPLVTTGPDTDVDTAGELGQAGTEVLFGDKSVLKDLRAGGRLTLGTWIDPSCCRSLVMRGWFAGEETVDFRTDQSINSVIARPFQNVSDNQVAAQDTQIIAFPDRASGSISVSASSEVFGADVSARQKWFSRFGGTVDVLYGYQFMRLNEGLDISSTSLSQDDDFAPVGSVLSIDDSFEAENEFHGGQFGFASRYREGCWSFHSLAKVGFGRLQRTATLSGQTLTSIDGNNATDPNGLLVRSTNSGETKDNTFGWVPELDFTLGWHQYPRFDLTIGYHVIAMTDAIQVGGLIDPALEVNLSDPPTGQQSPARQAGYGTFYVQGIHFGLQHVY